MATKLVILPGYSIDHDRGQQSSLEKCYVSGFYLRLETDSAPKVDLWMTGVEEIKTPFKPVYVVYESKQNSNLRLNLDGVATSHEPSALALAHSHIVSIAQDYSRDLKLSIEDRTSF